MGDFEGEEAPPQLQMPISAGKAKPKPKSKAGARAGTRACDACGQIDEKSICPQSSAKSRWCGRHQSAHNAMMAKARAFDKQHRGACRVVEVKALLESEEGPSAVAKFDLEHPPQGRGMSRGEVVWEQFLTQKVKSNFKVAYAECQPIEEPQHYSHMTGTIGMTPQGATEHWRTLVDDPTVKMDNLGFRRQNDSLRCWFVLSHKTPLRSRPSGLACSQWPWESADKRPSSKSMAAAATATWWPSRAQAMGTKVCRRRRRRFTRRIVTPLQASGAETLATKW